jgi:hypothetical protein
MPVVSADFYDKMGMDGSVESSPKSHPNNQIRTGSDRTKNCKDQPGRNTKTTCIEVRGVRVPALVKEL